MRLAYSVSKVRAAEAALMALVPDGALMQRAAAGLAATLYASHCTDDSPLFVATWYPIATAMVVAAGALIGAKVLRF